MPKEWFWYDPAYELTAEIFDAVHRTAAFTPRPEGMKRSEIPKRLPRPWEKSTEIEKLGGEAAPLDEVRTALGW